MWLSEEGNMKYKHLKFSFKLTAEVHIVLCVGVLCLWSEVQQQPHPKGMLRWPLKKALTVVGLVL